MKIWMFVCFLFLVSLIRNLTDQRYDCTYVLEKQVSEVNRKQAVCIPFQQIFSFNQASRSTTLEWLKLRLLSHFRTTNLEWSEKLMIVSESRFREVIVALIKLNKFYIHNYHFCLLLNRRFSLIFLPSPIYMNLTFFVFEREPFVFFLDGNSDPFSDFILSIENQEYPYSKCRKLTEDGRALSRFECVNDCLKSRQRSLQYYYRADEAGEVDFFTNNSLQAQQSCFEGCQENCELKFYFNALDNFHLIDSERAKKFKALPSTSDFDFYLQLISIVFLFVNFSFFGKFPVLFGRLLSRVPATKNLDITRSVRAATFIVCLVSFAALFVRVKGDFDRQLAAPLKRETSTTLIDLEPLSLLVCVPVQRILLNDFSDENDKTDKSKLYLNKTPKALEILTEVGFNQTIQKIYVSIEEVKQPVTFSLSNGVYFRLAYWFGLLRCFRVELKVKQMKFQSILQISKLIIEFKHEFYSLFLLSEGQPYTLYTPQFQPRYDVRKIIIKRSKNVNCLDYGQMLELNCESRSACIDRCINDEYSKRNASLNYNTILVKDYFSESQWASYPLREAARHGLSWIKKRCERRFRFKDCAETYFSSSTRKDYESLSINLNLFYEIVTLTEQTASVGKLVFDLLNLQSVLFGFNVLKIFLACFALLNVRFRLRNSRAVRGSIHVLCLLAFAAHGYFWLDEALNGEMVNSQSYEMLSVKPMSELVFCFKFSHKKLLDGNVRPTGQYLSRMTSDISVQTVFDRFEYLDETNRWVVLNASSLPHSTGHRKLPARVLLSEFFYLNKKCFLVRLMMQYRRHQFLYGSATDVLRVKFREAFISKKENLTFFTKKPDTMQTSKIINCYFASKHQIHLSEELFELEVYDKLQLLKHPWSLFYAERHVNDVNTYIRRVLKTFKETYRRSTTSFPLRVSNYEFELDDEMFVQYYRQVQQAEDERAPKNYNFKRQFIVNHFSLLPERIDFGLKFSLIFCKKNILLTSAQSYPGLILGLLNLLSIYLNLSVLDLQDYLGAIRSVFSLVHVWLIGSRTVLRSKLVDVS